MKRYPWTLRFYNKHEWFGLVSKAVLPITVATSWLWLVKFRQIKMLFLQLH